MTASHGVVMLYHPRVDASRHLAGTLEAQLSEAGHRVVVVSAWDDAAVTVAIGDQPDLVVTLGGDGTLLRAARTAAAVGAPVVGVNFGRLGFLAEIAPPDAETLLPRLLAGEGVIEDRLMLQCTASDDVTTFGPHDAVNDVYVGRGRIARAVRLRVALDGAPLARFAADGIVVATPTGSTAYSLSAGGPIVATALDAIVVTPVVAHPRAFAPLVMPPSSRVALHVETDEDASIAIDGQVHSPLRNGGEVVIEASPLRARFVRLGDGPTDYGASFVGSGAARGS
jgi:NAD+ kinase